jgi:hypothetical protein
MFSIRKFQKKRGRNVSSFIWPRTSSPKSATPK